MVIETRVVIYLLSFLNTKRVLVLRLEHCDVVICHLTADWVCGTGAISSPRLRSTSVETNTNHLCIPLRPREDPTAEIECRWRPRDDRQFQDRGCVAMRVRDFQETTTITPNRTLHWKQVNDVQQTSAPRSRRLLRILPGVFPVSLDGLLIEMPVSFVCIVLSIEIQHWKLVFATNVGSWVRVNTTPDSE